MSIKAFVEKRWYAKKPGSLILAAPLEFLYKKIAQRRKTKLTLSQYQSSLPVVVVGNIVLGGTGKTPVIIALVKLLKQHQLKVGVVSRGYGRSSRKLHILDANSTVLESGDEPLEIYRETGCYVAVSANRVEAIQSLEAMDDIDLIISDDGLQHYTMARDIEIAVFNQIHGAGNRHCLPVGPLREPESRLEHVDFILVNQSGASEGNVKDFLPEAYLEKRYRFDVTPHHWVSVGSSATDPGAIKDLDGLNYKKACAMAGMGQPEKFYSSVRALGYQFDIRTKGDHEALTSTDFDTANYDAFLMTAKDAVKASDIAPENSWYLKVEAALSPLFASKLVERISDLIKNKNAT